MKVEVLELSVLSLRLRVLSTSIFYARASAAGVPLLCRVRGLSACLSRSWLGFTGDTKAVVGGEEEDELTQVNDYSHQQSERMRLRPHTGNNLFSNR